MKYFIGFPCPLQLSMEGLPSGFAAMRSIDMHATLAFFGEVSAEVAHEAFLDALDELGRRRVQAVCLERMSPLGGGSSLALTFDVEPQDYKRASAAANAAYDSAKIARSHGTWLPHVTIAKAVDGATRVQLAAGRAWAGHPRYSERLIVFTSVALYRRAPADAGQRYQVVTAQFLDG